MDDREEDWELPPTTRLRPASLGRGLPVPPVIPLVAVFCVLIGLALGYGFVPKSNQALPIPTEGAASPIASSIAATIPIGGPAASVGELPPAGGLSLVQVLGRLQEPGVTASAVISAQVARYPAVSTDWVWLLVVPYTVPLCNDDWISELGVPAASIAPCQPTTTTEMFIFDYRTGELLEDRIPAY